MDPKGDRNSVGVKWDDDTEILDFSSPSKRERGPLRDVSRPYLCLYVIKSSVSTSSYLHMYRS